MFLQCGSCFNLGLVCMGILKPVKCIKDCHPVIISEIVLNLLDIHVCCLELLSSAIYSIYYSRYFTPYLSGEEKREDCWWR